MTRRKDKNAKKYDNTPNCLDIVEESGMDTNALNVVAIQHICRKEDRYTLHNVTLEMEIVRKKFRTNKNRCEFKFYNILEKTGMFTNSPEHKMKESINTT